MRLGLGLGVAARRAARVIPGGTISAASSAATFEALGGTWTIGDTSPVLWTLAGEGETEGDTQASIAAVTDWAASGLTESADGDWLRFTCNAYPSDAQHHIGSALTDSVTGAPCQYVIDVRRGSPPPGEATNKIRLACTGTTATVDVNLDTGAIISGTYEYCTATPLDAVNGDPDAGYRIALTTASHNSAGTVGAYPLVGTSDTFTDATGAGYFRIKNAATVVQRRLAAWADFRGGAYTDAWAQATAAAQLVKNPVTGRPVFSGAQFMSCHGLAALGGAGAATAFTVALAFRKNATDEVQNPWAFRNSSTGRVVQLTYRKSSPRFTFDRIQDNSEYRHADLATALPFCGVVICRYDGTTLRMKVDGVDAETATQTGALTTDQLWLGTADGSLYKLTGSIYQTAI
jgi:hypothetical protein